MGREGILWILCLGQLLNAAGALPMYDDEDLTEEGLLDYTECQILLSFNSIQARVWSRRICGMVVRSVRSLALVRVAWRWPS